MKNILKRITSVFLAVTIIFSSALVGLNEIDFSSVFAVKAEAAKEILYGDFFYVVTNKEKKTCKITGIALDDDDNGYLKIPKTIKSYTVTEIADDACSWNYDLEEIDIPKTVKKIGKRAFEYCSKLTVVNLAEGVTEIGEGAFGRCQKLTSITIPSSVEKIATEAFCYSEKLKSVTLKKGLKEIGSKAFFNTNISTIIIPSSVKKIGWNAFGRCDKLKKAEMPSKVDELGSGIFEDASLTSVNLPQNITEIPDRMFSGCDLKKISFPESLSNIGEYAFWACDFSGTMVIPGHIKEIENNAFYYCNKLERVYIEEGVETVNKNAFSECENLLTVYYPDSVKNIISGSGSLKNIKIHANEGSYAAEYFGASNHVFTSEVVAPTCLDGYTLYTCECGYSYKGDFTEAIDTHEVVEVAYKQATKNEPGSMAGSYCSKCNTVFEGCEEIPQIGEVSLNYTSFAYNGKVKKPSVSIKDASGNKISSSYYSVSIPSSKEIGSYSCVVTFKGDYSGKITLKYEIVPKATTLAKFERYSGAVKVYWNSQKTNTSGYQIQYGKKKDLSDGKSTWVSSNKTTDKTIKKLSNAKYYFRIRTYKSIKKNGKTSKYYSSWSPTSMVYATNKTSVKVLNHWEKCRDMRYDDYYSYQYAYNNQVRIFAELKRYYRDYDIDKIYLYRATSKNGTYKRIKTFYYDDLYGENDKRLAYYDENVKPNKAYYYKITISYLPDDYNSAKGLGSLSPDERIYDSISTIGEYHTTPSYQFQLRTKGPNLTWKKVKGVEGYQVFEKAYERQGYNIYGQPVYGVTKNEYLTTSVGGRSKIYSRLIRPGQSEIIYSVYPYQKINGYYYCHAEEVKKKLPCDGYTTDVSVGR